MDKPEKRSLLVDEFFHDENMGYNQACDDWEKYLKSAPIDVEGTIKAFEKEFGCSSNTDGLEIVVTVDSDKFINWLRTTLNKGRTPIDVEEVVGEFEKEFPESLYTLGNENTHKMRRECIIRWWRTTLKKLTGGEGELWKKNIKKIVNVYIA